MIPRALPWATIGCPFGAEEQMHIDIGERLRHGIRTGEELGRPFRACELGADDSQGVALGYDRVPLWGGRTGTESECFSSTNGTLVFSTNGTLILSTNGAVILSTNGTLILSTNGTLIFSANGEAYRSPGHRPGFTNQKNQSPERAA
jgi:hypothetical protein